MKLSAETRTENIDWLQNNQLDLLVIGGGITGAGTPYMPVRRRWQSD